MQQILDTQVAFQDLSGHKIGDYVCHSKLGSGSFATVYKGSLAADKSKVFAIKVVDKKSYGGPNSAAFLKLLDAQAKAMSICDSEYIVKCHKEYRSQRYIIFILDFCNGGSLYEEIDRRGKLPEPEAKRILKQLTKAFAEMHHKKIIHRDLKPENVFKHNEKYMIGDFGFCKVFQSLNDLTTTSLGSLVSMAPEVIDNKPYGIKADLWSLGCVYYEMLFGCPPYISTSYGGMKKVIKEGKLNLKDISRQSANFFLRVFVIDDVQRLSWSEMYKTALFRSPSMLMIQNHQHDVDLDEQRKIHADIEMAQLPGLSSVKELSDALENSSAVNGEDLEEFQSLPSSYKEKLKQRDLKEGKMLNLMICYKERLNFEMQKSLFIVTQILQPMAQINLKVNRLQAEFNLLALERCFYIMSPVNNALNNKKNIYHWEYYSQFLADPNQQSILKDFRIHYQVVNISKLNAQNTLTTFQNPLVSRVSDFLRQHIFSRSKYSQQKKFLDGIEGLDYTAPQHNGFAAYKYIPEIVKTLQSINSPNKQKSAQKLIRALMAYGQIASLKWETGQGKKELAKIYSALDNIEPQ